MLGPSDPGYVAASHTPIVIGRVLPANGGPFQNARTDTPLLAWHEDTAIASGHHLLEYSLVWSNEDGGTNTPAGDPRRILADGLPGNVTVTTIWSDPARGLWVVEVAPVAPVAPTAP